MRAAVDNFRILFGRYSSLRFVLVGILNTVFGYCCYALFIFLGLTLPWASLLALLTGILWSFFTQGKIVFQHTSISSFVRFVCYWAVIYFVNLEIIIRLMRWNMNEYTAGALATIPVTIISFFSLKYIVFRK